MVEDILTSKEIEERAQQAAGNADNGWISDRESRTVGSGRFTKKRLTVRVFQENWLSSVPEEVLTYEMSWVEDSGRPDKTPQGKN